MSRRQELVDNLLTHLATETPGAMSGDTAARISGGCTKVKNIRSVAVRDHDR
jgi:hypothetical protein